MKINLAVLYRRPTTQVLLLGFLYGDGTTGSTQMTIDQLEALDLGIPHITLIRSIRQLELAGLVHGKKSGDEHADGRMKFYTLDYGKVLKLVYDGQEFSATETEAVIRFLKHEITKKLFCDPRFPFDVIVP